MLKKIKHTYTLDIVNPKDDDIILADPVLLKKVAEFYNTHADTIILIANCLNHIDAKYLIETALDEEVPIVRAKLVARESFVTDLMKYSAEQARRDKAEAEKKEMKEDTDAVESQPTADEELTLESPPTTEEEKGSV